MPKQVVVTGASAGARGRFGGRSSDFSPQVWLNEHLPLAAAVVLGTATAAIAPRYLRGYA